MSQRVFEAALGRLICDDAFRREFFEDPEGTMIREGLQLTGVEFGSLCKTSLEAVEAFVAHVDDRVRRAGEPVAGQGKTTGYWKHRTVKESRK